MNRISPSEAEHLLSTDWLSDSPARDNKEGAQLMAVCFWLGNKSSAGGGMCVCLCAQWTAWYFLHNKPCYLRCVKARRAITEGVREGAGHRVGEWWREQREDRWEWERAASLHRDNDLLWGNLFSCEGKLLLPDSGFIHCYHFQTKKKCLSTQVFWLCFSFNCRPD